MQFLSGPERSPSCDGALRLRSAAAATAASRCRSICLLGRPTGFLGRGPEGPRPRAAAAAPEQGPPPPPPEFSEGPEGLPSPRPEDEDEDEEELLAEEPT